jgi:hypothetical protein
MWWRPAHDRRACYGYWFLSKRLMQSDMSVAAAKAIYSVFNLMPARILAANDRDHCRW